MSTLDGVLAKLRNLVLDVPLKDVSRSEYSQEIDAPSFEIGAGDIAVTASAETEFDLLVLNQPTDSDDDDVFATSITGPDGETVAPFISFDTQKAWLKYKLTGTLSGAAAPGIFSLGANASVALAGYRAHAATDNALAAIDDDRQSFRTIVRKSDVKALAVGEALTMQIAGDLSASVSFSWSDALSMSISELTSLIPSSVPVTIDLDAGLKATASVKVSDDFFLVMSRPSNGTLRIAINKAASRTTGVKVTASLSATVDASEVPKDVLDAALEGVLGVKLSEAEELSDEIVEFLANRFGTSKAKDVVKAKVGSLKSDVEAKLEKIATLKAQIGFAYEYQRVDSRSAIIDYTLPDALLDQDYEPAIKGDFTTLVNRVSAGGARTALRFLNQRTVTQTSAFGFTLGFGPWSVTFKDTNTRQMTERKNFDESKRMLTFKGARAYTAPRLGDDNDYTWVVDLAADMSEYKAKPVSKDFTYGLTYLVTFNRKNLSANDVARLADFATMWRISTSDAATAALQKCVGQAATVAFELVFNHDPLLQITRQIPANDPDAWAESMAAAVPYLSGEPSRTSLAKRIQLFTPLCRTWLTSAPLTVAQWKNTIQNRVPGVFETSPNLLSFLRMVTDGYPNVQQNRADFVEGITQLPLLMQSDQDDEHDIQRAYSKLKAFWDQRPYICASGVYLLTRANDAGLLSSVERTMTITSGGTSTTVTS